jgi:Fe2+ or Zn2+ uptake regulation protein
MPNSLQQLSTSLKNHGFSLTITRKAVFNALRQHGPLTMHELVLACPTIDRSSVYRTVLLFERLSMLQRLQIGWKYKLELSDAFQQHHHHATCLHCGRVVVLPEHSGLERQLRSLAGAQAFAMHDHQLEIQGLCSNCRPA